MNILLGTGTIIGLIVLAVVIVLIIALVGWLIGTYNNLVKSRNKVKNQFSQIDVQLKRRFDLIPNLVETVKGYAVHEDKIFSQFAEARKQFEKAKTSDDAVPQMAQADAKLTSGFHMLMNAVRESYPQLQANENFQKLMATLTETEEKIAFSRQFYNDVVLSFNNQIEVFPNSLVAGMFHFKIEQYFEAGEESRENVQVKF